MPDQQMQWILYLVNRRRRALVNEVSISLGYPTIEIIAPPEL